MPVVGKYVLWYAVSHCNIILRLNCNLLIILSLYFLCIDVFYDLLCFVFQEYLVQRGGIA